MSFIAAAHFDSGSASTATINKPTGTVDNDIMFAILKRIDNTDPTTVPSGWTVLATNLVGGGNSLWMYYRVAASEGASYDWVWAVAGRCGGSIYTYRSGFNTANPVDVVSNTAYTTSNTTVRAASMTVSAANSTLVFFGAFHSASAGSFTVTPTVPTTFTKDSDTDDLNSRFGRSAMSVVWSSSGTTGDMDATIDLTLADKHAFAVALNPAAGGGGPTVTWVGYIG